MDTKIARNGAAARARLGGSHALLLGAVAAVCAGAAWAQLRDITQAPNAAGEGIAKSLAEQIGPGRGDLLTPGEGTRLEARLRPPQGDGSVDALAVDDRAFALLPPRTKQRVLLVSAGNLFLEGALLLDENLAVTKIAPNAYDPADTARFDAVIFDGYTPEDAPRVHALYLAPDGPGSPWKSRGRGNSPSGAGGAGGIMRDAPRPRTAAPTPTPPTTSAPWSNSTMLPPRMVPS